MVADGGLGVVEFLGGRGERTGAGDGDEDAETNGVQHLIDATREESIDAVYGFFRESLLDLSMRAGSVWSS
ncbi:hypothetical protein HerbRD11066_36390 [Herbidospora sp. RD11066]